MIKLTKNNLFLLAIASLALFFIAQHVRAQVEVTGIPEGSVVSCLVDSSDSSIQGMPQSTNDVPLFISSDNNIYAIRGNYNVNIYCGDMVGTQYCTNLQNAFNTISTINSAIPNFPQVISGASNNNLNILVGHFNGVCKTGSTACEITEAVYENDGLHVKATIFFDEDEDADPPATQNAHGSPNVPFILNNPNLIQSLLNHEMGHAFGLGDSYLFNGVGSHPGLMGTGYVPLYTNPSLPPVTWDSSLIAAIQAINIGNPISLTSPTCLNRLQCASEQVEGWKVNDSDGYYYQSCLTPSSVSDISYCDCNPPNDNDAYCTTDGTDRFAPPNPDYCSSTGVGGFNCTDDACVYDASGGEYGDFTSCEAACGQATTEPGTEVSCTLTDTCQ